MRGLMIVAAALLLVVQEREITKDFYCTNHPKAPESRRCACQRTCTRDPDGRITEQEDPACKVYCKRDHCTCQSPCDTHT